MRRTRKAAQMGKGEVEESVLTELLRGSPILGLRNKVITYTYESNYYYTLL